VKAGTSANGVQPFYLSSRKGRLFCLHVPATGTPAHNQAILFFPPFAEEMNKSRRIVTQQARRFAALGYSVLIPDPYGTGDSEGDFGDADWDTWHADMEHAVRWLREQGAEKIVFWGMRLGAALALQAAGKHAQAPDGILLWQPVLKGKTFLTQFLRLRLAADLMGEGEKITTKELRARLENGESVEVAGYLLSPGLASGIDRIDLLQLVPPGGCRVAWLELLPDAERPVPAMVGKTLDAWKGEGFSVKFETLVCEHFWGLAELVTLPALIDRSAEILAKDFQ